MRAAVFDLETDGLLDTVTKVHVMVVRDLQTDDVRVFREAYMVEGLKHLDTFDTLVGHNSINYDAQVLKKLYGYERPWHHHRDTMVLARLIWPEVIKIDLERIKKQQKEKREVFPQNLVGLHSLEAWGRRLGDHKSDYEGDPLIPDEKTRKAEKWLRWNQAMEDYCIQDVGTTTTLYRKILSKGDSWIPLVLIETQVAHILGRQERYGFLFDQRAAIELMGELAQRRLDIELAVKKDFLPRLLRDGPVFTPKRDDTKRGYVAGAPFQKLKLTEFNPGSRDHVAHWLKVMYGWEPKEFTPEGKAKVDETVISQLDYPNTENLKAYFMVSKRLGQLSEGKQAWLTSVGKDGRMHGRVNPMGCATSRMSHSSPNMGQVPAGYSPYGHECRALFCVPPGKALVGCDADALELRDMAGYMARYDGGAYIKVVLNGDKSIGTDMHSVNCRAIGMDPKGLYHDGETGRDIAKTWFYAFLYGAGDEKLGFILLRVKGPKAIEAGKASRSSFEKNLPALGKLVKAVKAAAKEKGWLKGIDGRQVPVRSQHAALNTLLQSAGAIQMKKALCLLDDSLQQAGLVPGVHYEFVANVHDEFQLEVDEDRAEQVGTLAVQAIRDSGTSFQFRCPLDGQWVAGRNWNETH